MADRSKIEWTDASWNPIRARNRTIGKVGWHCEHVSPGCANCYSEGFNARLGTQLPFKPGHRADVEITLDAAMLLHPPRWARPRMIFVCSMTDLFADFVPDAVIDQVFAVMALCPQHTFQVLTKRSARMRTYLADLATPRRVYEAACDMMIEQRITGLVLIAPGYPNDAPPPGPRVYLGTWPLPNVWLGVSAEDQRRLDERAPDLIAAPAAMRFLSAEPLLGPLDVKRFMWPVCASWTGPYMNWRDAAAAGVEIVWKRQRLVSAHARFLDWIIVGGESGPGARPMHPSWARSLRDQCATAGVPFFFKQWGEWAPLDLDRQPLRGKRVRRDWMILDADGDLDIPDHRVPDDDSGECAVVRAGKKVAGRLLDGVEHNAMPHHAPALAGAA